MLKTLNTKSTKPRKTVIGVGSGREKHDNKVELVGKDEIDDNEVKDNDVGKKQKMFKSKKLFKSKKTIGFDFFTPKTRLAFIKLR